MKLVANLTELAGFVLVCAGFWAIWAPLGAIVAGVTLVVVAQATDRSGQ